MNDVQVNTFCTLGEIAGKEIEKGLHFRVECLDGRDERGVIKMRVGLTFFVAVSSTVDTRREISLRMAFAATPVVAVLKSM